MIMARRKLKDKLINKNDITEQLSLINGSNTDYITLPKEDKKDPIENNEELEEESNEQDYYRKYRH